MKVFNTKIPCNASAHYFVERNQQLEEALCKIMQREYVQICAPRKSGKTSFLLNLQEILENKGYSVLFLSEGEAGINEMQTIFTENLPEIEKIILISDNFTDQSKNYIELLNKQIQKLRTQQIPGITSIITTSNCACKKNKEIEAKYAKKSNSIDLEFFTLNEIKQLFNQFTQDSKQIIDDEVIQRIKNLTYGNPYLVNAFAATITSLAKGKAKIELDDFEKTEKWHMENDFDNYLPQIINEVLKIRPIVERFLFKDKHTYFDTQNPELVYLFENSLIRPDDYFLVRFWVPFYKNRIFQAFYHTDESENTYPTDETTNFNTYEQNTIQEFQNIIAIFKSYVKKYGYTGFQELRADGFQSIKEAVLIYNFEKFLRGYLTERGGNMQLIANTAIGQSGKLVNLQNNKWVIEHRVYVNEGQFIKGKQLLAENCNTQNVDNGIYIVFLPEKYKAPASVRDKIDKIQGATIQTFIILVNESKDFKTRNPN